MVTFKVKSTQWYKTSADVLVVLVSLDGWVTQLKDLDRSLGGHLIPYLKDYGFKGEQQKTYTHATYGKLPSKTVLVVGVGKLGELTPTKVRLAAASAFKVAHQLHVRTVAIDLTGEVASKIQMQTFAQVVVEGVALGTYTFRKYKTPKPDEVLLEEAHLLTTPARLQHAANGLKEGEMTSEATLFARNLVNESPTLTTPTYLAHVAKSLGKKTGVTVEVLDRKDVQKLGMGAFLAVAAGSREAPKFIKMTYKGGRKKVVIAGKAVTFDTGGLQLKPAHGMETMKLDMAGAAAVFGLFSVLPLLKPKVTVVGLIAACENMPGESAMKPGDIVRTMGGTTIEIGHTDAEGRLTLADVFSYAQNEKPDYLIDLATLTGASQIALGEEIAALFTNDKALGTQLKTASADAGEKIWELPLEAAYKELNKSEVADIRNVPKTRYGGAITAALFLQEFVNGLPWAHLDIAGPAYQERETTLVPKGGSGFGARTLISFLKNL